MRGEKLLPCNEDGKAKAFIHGTSYSLPDDAVINESTLWAKLLRKWEIG